MSEQPIVTGFGMAAVTIAVIVLSMWVIRPMMSPRHGQWDGEGYYVNGVECGTVEDRTFYGAGFSAYATPPIWVGLDSYETYQSLQNARKKVEDSCR